MKHEDIVICNHCNWKRYVEDTIYDRYNEQYYCDSDCFYEWAENNIEIVELYYKQNIE